MHFFPGMRELSETVIVRIDVPGPAKQYQSTRKYLLIPGRVLLTVESTMGIMD